METVDIFLLSPVKPLHVDALHCGVASGGLTIRFNEHTGCIEVVAAEGTPVTFLRQVGR